MQSKWEIDDELAQSKILKLSLQSKRFEEAKNQLKNVLKSSMLRSKAKLLASDYFSDDDSDYAPEESSKNQMTLSDRWKLL